MTSWGEQKLLKYSNILLAIHYYMDEWFKFNNTIEFLVHNWASCNRIIKHFDCDLKRFYKIHTPNIKGLSFGLWCYFPLYLLTALFFSYVYNSINLKFNNFLFFTLNWIEWRRWKKSQRNLKTETWNVKNIFPKFFLCVLKLCVEKRNLISKNRKKEISCLLTVDPHFGASPANGSLPPLYKPSCIAKKWFTFFCIKF